MYQGVQIYMYISAITIQCAYSMVRGKQINKQTNKHPLNNVYGWKWMVAGREAVDAWVAEMNTFARPTCTCTQEDYKTYVHTMYRHHTPCMQQEGATIIKVWGISHQYLYAIIDRVVQYGNIYRYGANRTNALTKEGQWVGCGTRVEANRQLARNKQRRANNYLCKHTMFT